MDTRKTLRITTRLDHVCVQRIDTILSSVVNRIGMTCVITYKERESSIWLPVSFASWLRFWNFHKDGIHDLQLLIKWDKSTSDPTSKIVCGVESAHNRTTYFMCSRSIETIVGSTINTIGGPKRSLQEKKIFNLSSYSFCNPTLILMLEMIVWMVCSL